MEPTRRLGLYSVSGALLLALGALPGCSQEQLPSQVPCSQTVQALAAAALAHIVEARDLPDFGLLAADRPILVSNRISGLSCELRDDVLPTPSELPMRLATPAELQSAANTQGQAQYVEMSDPQGFDDPEASIRVGVGVLLPENSDGGLVCCCSGEATFREVEGTLGLHEVGVLHLFLAAGATAAEEVVSSSDIPTILGSTGADRSRIGFVMYKPGR